MALRFRSTLRLLLLAGLLALASAPSAAQPAELKGFDAYVQQAMKAWGVPGLAVAVVQDDRIVYERGFGVREQGRPELVDEHTLFAVASNTKAVTTASLAVLAQEGKLSWDDRATRYLPTLQLFDPYATRELTLRDLVTHRAGYDTWAGDLLWYGSNFPREEVLSRLRLLPPSFSFRSRFGYSNLLFIAAGEVIPAVTDTTWEAFVQARFLEPLGMLRTTPNVADLPLLNNYATPHTLTGGAITPTPYRELTAAAAAAGLNSSVHEWAQWLRLNLNDGLVDGRRLAPAAAMQQLRAPQFLIPLGARAQRLFPSRHFYAYGLGWFLEDYKGRLVASHSGGMDGMLSYTGFVPEEGLGVVIFTNYDEQSLYQALFYDILDRYLGGPRTDWSAEYLKGRPAEAPATPRPNAPSPLPMPAYAGVYANPLLGEATVAEEAGGLRLRLEHHAGLDGRLAPWHYNTFQSVWADEYLRRSLVTFDIDADGTPRAFHMKVREDFIDPLTYTFTRVR